ncbi:MAG: polysaccharide deacetylase family protein [Mariniphaga sp.]|nr:polysaccharide deacetylase family protein [Mariniphaga sp.]
MTGKFFWILLFLVSSLITRGSSWIRINQMGYLPQSVKVAVFISDESTELHQFQLVDAVSNKTVFENLPLIYDGSKWGMKSAARLNFSRFSTQGRYYIKAGNSRSAEFTIAPDVYKGSADYILNYMRQQRCGFNPYLKDSCHTHDGFIVDHPIKSGQIIDAKGGWHDATDYLQYTTTSANAVYQMLFAYSKNPEAYGDQYNAAGLPGADGIPDILNEIRWGLDWLVKMNPDSTEMYNQIADDRDHKGFRLPNKDTASYGNGLYRPVYFITGKVQGLSKYKNRSTGVSSTAGKFSSAFAMGAQIFQTDPKFSKLLAAKAKQAYAFGLTDLGVAQTTSVVSPYFYEEDNYIDDLELAAYELYKLSGEDYYLKQANYWGQLEPITPWMEKGSARHYQYYPFVNLGHANQANIDNPVAKTFSAFMNNGLKAIYERGKTDPFLNGIPYIWCSNNLNAAAITQARLYYEATSDTTYLEMEAALRDWLFGCNPWGTSMICGLPSNGDSPQYPHSSYTVINGEITFGGLVDGPVYKEIFNGHIGVGLLKKDVYEPFQNGIAVYHDDMGDYTSNEPTMDGTASLSYYLSSLEKEGIRQLKMKNSTIDESGALVRMDNNQKTIYLVFSADEYGEGADQILKTLSLKKIKGSFFLTGNFLRNPKFENTIKRMIADHHYVGPHSDRHLLYAPWEKRDSLLVTRKQFDDDITANFEQLGKFGVRPEVVKYFLPPYEWNNHQITKWSADRNMQLINFTPGVGTNADYTTPDLVNYKSSKDLTERLMKFESTNPAHLNGAIVLIHLGTHPDRTDKFYNSLNQIIEKLSKKGYTFKALT